VLLPFARQILRALRPDRQEHRVIPQVQIGDGEVVAPTPLHAELDPELPHGIDLGIE
jgi:hypothetical protein